MAQDIFTYTVSDSVLELIKKQLYGDWYNDKPYKLIVSLYAYRGKTEPEVIKSVRSDIYELEKEVGDALCAEYSAVIAHCFKLLGQYRVNFRPVGSFVLPEAVLKLCRDYIAPEDGSSVFLPFAGQGSFAVAMPSCCYDGTEITPSDWAVSRILFDAFGIKGSIRVVRNFDQSCILKDKVNYIFSVPPVGGVGSKETSRCESLVGAISDYLDDKGAACIILPTPVLSTPNWKPLRSYIIDNAASLKTTVVALPPIFNPVTAVEQSIVFIRKQTNPSSVIEFFNALNSCFYARRPFNDFPYVLKDDVILRELKNPSSDYLAFVPSSSLDADTNFSADRFFVGRVLPELREGEQIVKLSDLIEVSPSVRPPKELKRAKVILIRDLSDNYLTSDIDLGRISSSVPQGNSQVFPGSLFVSYIGGKFKVGKAPNPLPEPAFIRPEVTQFTIKDNAQVSVDFLLRSLMSDYVQRQARLLDSGVTITRLSKPDLLSLMIVLPPKKEQDRLVFSDGVAGMSQADQDRVRFFSEFRKDMHMKKHAIGQTIFNLNNWLMNLADAREECHGVLDDNAEVGGVVKIKVSDIYDNILLAMRILDKQISTLDAGYGMKSSSIALTTFITDYIGSHPYPRVRYDFNAKTSASEIVDFPEAALTIIFDNVVSNAVAHGFTDNSEHTIRFSVDVEGTNVVVSISNNGEPLPSDRNPEEIFIYGVSDGGKDHFGIGAYQVKNLMREFEGDAEVISTPDEDFTVTYRLVFTKTTLDSE